MTTLRNEQSSRRAFLRHAGWSAALGWTASRLPPALKGESEDNDAKRSRSNPERLAAIDCHIHLFHDRSVPGLLAGMDAVEVRSAALLSILYPGLGTLNANTLAVKAAAPDRLYAFCCIDYRGMTEPEWPDRAIAKLEAAVRAGADGIKMLLGKPGNPAAHFSLTHKRMQPLYEWFGKRELPVIFHVGDVPHFWDAAALGEWSTSPEGAGLYARFPHACLSPKEIRREVEELVATHPQVRFIFAHLAMPHDNLKWVSQLLKDNPQVSVDVSAPCSVGFLVRRPAEAREFLMRHRRQLCFGTDKIMMHTILPDECRDQYRDFAGSFRSVFETADEINWFFPQPYQGLNLPEDCLRRLFRDNFHALAGDPQPAGNSEALAAVIDEAVQDLHALQGVPNKDNFQRLSEQSLQQRERDFARDGTIANSVFAGGTIPSSFQQISLDMFRRINTAE